MKISSFILFLICVSLIFAVYGMMVHESNSQYGQTIQGYVPIDSSNWSGTGNDGSGGTYDFVYEINGTVGPLVDKFKLITNENEGWFTKLTAGITAIPYAVMLVPDILFTSLMMAGTVVTGFLTALSIPAYFIVAACIMILIWAVFKLLEYYQRVPI